MTESYAAAPPPAAPPDAVPSPAVQLWSPLIVGAVAGLLGFPGGLILAAADWERMGLRRRAVLHLICGAALALPLLLPIAALPELGGNAVGLGFNIAVALYLGARLGADIGRFKASGRRVENGSRLLAFLIGLGALAAWLLLNMAVGAALSVPRVLRHLSEV